LNKKKDDQELRKARDELWSIEADVRSLICKLEEILKQVLALNVFIEKLRRKK